MTRVAALRSVVLGAMLVVSFPVSGIAQQDPRAILQEQADRARAIWADQERLRAEQSRRVMDNAIRQNDQMRAQGEERRRAQAAQARAQLDQELARYREENPEGARIDENLCAAEEEKARNTRPLTLEERSVRTDLSVWDRVTRPGSPEKAREYCERSVATNWRQVRQKYLAEDPAIVLNSDRGPEWLVGPADRLEVLWRASPAPVFHMVNATASCVRFDWQAWGQTCAQGMANLVGESVGAGTLCGMTPRRARPIMYQFRNSVAAVGRGLGDTNDSFRVLDVAQDRVITSLQADKTARLDCSTAVRRIEIVEQLLNLRE